jgi:hypothetical protein
MKERNPMDKFNIPRTNMINPIVIETDGLRIQIHCLNWEYWNKIKANVSEYGVINPLAGNNPEDPHRPVSWQLSVPLYFHVHHLKEHLKNVVSNIINQPTPPRAEPTAPRAEPIRITRSFNTATFGYNTRYIDIHCVNVFVWGAAYPVFSQYGELVRVGDSSSKTIIMRLTVAMNFDSEAVWNYLCSFYPSFQTK